MSELIKSNFEIVSKGNNFTVHPNLFSMISLKHSRDVEKLFGDRYVPVMRQASLSMFIDHLLDNFQAKLGKTKDFTWEEIDQVLWSSVETYKAEKANDFLKNI